MSLHLSEQNIERFRRGELSAGELAALDEHLAACSECGRRIAGEGASPPDAARAALRAAAQDDFTHLQYEEIESLINGTLDDAEREVAESHLAVCLACADDVADLRAFREELEVEKPSHAAEPSPVTRPVRIGLGERLRAAFRSPSLGFSPSYALAAVVLLLVFAGVLFFALRQPEQVPREVANQNAPALTPTPEVARAVDPPPSPTPSARETPTPETIEQRPALALEDGAGTTGLDARGELIGLEALAPAERRRVKEALAGGRVEASDALGGLTARRGVLMSGGADGVPFRLKGPFGVVLRSRSPSLGWEPLAGADAYSVTVVDDAGRVVARSPELKQTTWTVSPALPRGKTYAWQVAARKDGAEVVSPAPPAPEARFKVLDAAQVAALERAERNARGSHLALGVLYARAGLLEDAERELRALLARNPRSDVARRLLQSVRAARAKRW